MVEAGSRTPVRASAARVAVALLAVYLVWGSTYLGIRVVVTAGLPPFGAMGTRFLTSGVLLLALLVARSGTGRVRVPRRQLAGLALQGTLFLCIGNGFVAVAEQTVTSGLAALLVGATPLWVVLLGALTGLRTRGTTWLGTVVGFAGVALLARPGAQPEDVAWWGVATILVGGWGWSSGTVLSRRLDLPADAFVSAARQMVLGGGVMLVVSLVRGEPRGFSLAQVHPDGWVALVYLTLVGSLVAYTAFYWLLGHAPLPLVSTYAYVNPVVAVFLGWLLLDERPTAAVLVGGAVAVLGVAIVISTERRPDPRVSDPT